VTGQRGRINILSVVMNQGEMEYEVTEHNINSETYVDFLSKLIDGRSRPLILMADRATFHFSRTVREFVRENRSRIRVYFLPKYAPDYNPAEQLWGEVKVNRIRRQPVTNKRDLKDRVKSAIESVKSDIKRIRSFFMTPCTEYAASKIFIDCCYPPVK
jgi:transposase